MELGNECEITLMKTSSLTVILASLIIGCESWAQGDITGIGDPVIGGQMIGGVFVVATEGVPVGNSNMYPANGRPTFTIDNNFATSYRNFGEINTAFVITPNFGSSVGGTGVSGIQFATAIDAPERDPLTFVLEGTRGDPLIGPYTLIASGNTGFANDPGRTTGVLGSSFPVVGAFTSYRVTFPTIRDSTTADSMQIGEVAIVGLAAPEPSILSLLAISALGLLGVRRRRLAAE